MKAANPPNVFQTILAIGGIVLYVCTRFLIMARRDYGSWKEARLKLFKKPKRWQMVLFSILWGIILAAVVLIFVTYRR